MSLITFVVMGLPAPQGSKSFLGVRGGRGILVESAAAGVKAWRARVVAAALWARQPAPLDGPLEAQIVFTVPKPRRAPIGRRTYPCTRPDLSKLLRATEDALTDARLIADDARIVEFSRLAKVYPNEDPQALEAPGARITVATVAIPAEAGARWPAGAGIPRAPSRPSSRRHKETR